ncbi:DUF881 domain-containing protein [Streptomyces coeruleorubidus]|uniref:DUF881 domain-containing protein n=1 Tax=Streptomyces coeruleorubidus TaxID=116188 RepID=UPI003655E4C3
MSEHDDKRPEENGDTRADQRGGNGESGNRLRRELPQEVSASVPAARDTPDKDALDQDPPEAGAEPVPEPEVAPEPDSEPQLTGRQRLVKGLWPPRVSRAQFIVAVLLFGLGFGLAVQVASNSDSDSALRGARQEDLVRILDELDDRTQRLEDEKQGLEKQRDELENSSDQAEEARKQTIEKERQLGILAGTVAAQGPGITMTIEDTKGTVEADMLLDAVQELRAAGAEAIQVNGVRVVAGTYLTDSGKGVSVDGNKINAPYRFKVIGKPQDLEPALNIPGGVVQTLEKEQATVTIERSTKIVVDALRAVKRPDYARSSSQ